MLRLSALTCACLALCAAAVPAIAQTASPQSAAVDSGAFLILRGRDTVATEHFSRTATELRGTLTIRGAERGVQRYRALVGSDATMPMLEVTVQERPDSAGRGGRLVQRAQVIFKGDSAAVDALTERGVETRLFGTRQGALPFLNLSFALLEQAVRRARTLRGSPVEIPFFNLGGGQTAVGKFAAVGADSLVFTIGEVEFRLRVDRAGRLLGARIPSQDVVVKRT